MGTEATIDAPRAGQAFVDRPEPRQGPQAGVAPRQGEPLMPPARSALDDLIEAARLATKKQVSAFVAQPGGLLGLGVAGQDADGFLVMEIPVAHDQIPDEVAKAVDTIRFFLDDQLNAERDRMRRLLA